jgi:Fe-S oxidoreductase
MNVCPVEIGHIPKLVGARQSRVLMESKFPAELNAVFRNLETNSNPWGLGFAKRGDWAAGLDVPLFAAAPGAEYLLWVGCFGAYDDGGRNVAQAMVRLLKAANVTFGILGAEEKCCGDSARRLGNEYLFQSLARENLEKFLERGVRKIVTICPHGLNTFKHEYPALVELLKIGSPAEREALRRIEVVSHVELIDELIRSGRLALEPRAASAYTIHDSCYLARHNAIVREPRSVLDAALAGRRIELANAKEHGFCCGAGGGLMWTEESLGTRINHLRTEEIIASGAGLAASACPLCLTMLRDGLKDKNRPDIRVADVAELAAEALKS